MKDFNFKGVFILLQVKIHEVKQVYLISVCTFQGCFTITPLAIIRMNILEKSQTLRAIYTMLLQNNFSGAHKEDTVLSKLLI